VGVWGGVFFFVFGGGVLRFGFGVWGFRVKCFSVLMLGCVVEGLGFRVGV